jgi:N-6 DNA Methylase
MNPDPAALRANLADLVRYRYEHLTGDEKGEAQVFLDHVFRAFGHEGVAEAGATLEGRIKKRDQRGTAFVDLIWKPRCLIEMKKSGTNLTRHYRQAFDYWVEAVPDRPRYVVLCNFDEFWVYDFDIQLDEPMDRVKLDDIVRRYDALAFLLPQQSNPVFGNDLVAVTRTAAASVASVFTRLHGRGVDREQAQRFTLQSVMAMFAEDIGLLPSHVFTRALEDSLAGGNAYDLLFGLFREMNTSSVTPGGRYQGVPYFNGGLFANITPFELRKSELESLRAACQTDWSAVRPEIFGTLFEQSMEGGERHAHGAHFTSQADIVKIVGPTIVMPWRERIAAAKKIEDLERLLGELYNFKVLDPACGSGNFLYVAYRELRRIENEIHLKIAERRRPSSNIQPQLSYIPTDHFYGIDVNPFAVEIAKVTMMLAKKLSADELDDHLEVLPLEYLDDTIVAGDALFVPWPTADVIISNPPYLGRRKMILELGAEYSQRLGARYPKVSGVSDFVTYWFPLAHDHLPVGGRAGLVATNTIRQNTSREASLDYIVDNKGIIFDAVSSQPWSGDAAVTVSIINWSKEVDVSPKVLWLNNGQLRLPVDNIPSSLSPRVDVRKADVLFVNNDPATCFQGQTPGITKGYVISATVRHELVKKDPRSSAVIHPFLGGRELLHRTSINKWIIDIPWNDALEAESRAPGAMEYLRTKVLPERNKLLAREVESNRKGAEESDNFKPEDQHQKFMTHWWQLWRRRPELLDEVGNLDRYIATSRVASEQRLTVLSFVDSKIWPGDALSVFALDDEYSFGVLSSKLHREWLEARCSTLETRLRYTSTTVWDSYPWPQIPSDSQAQTIAQITASILSLRERYLDRGISLAKQYDTLRTPGDSRLRQLHEELDQAVYEAYGFSPGDDAISQLLALNQDLASDPGTALGPRSIHFDSVRLTDYKISPPIA